MMPLYHLFSFVKALFFLFSWVYRKLHLFVKESIFPRALTEQRAAAAWSLPWRRLPLWVCNAPQTYHNTPNDLNKFHFSYKFQQVSFIKNDDMNLEDTCPNLYFILIWLVICFLSQFPTSQVIIYFLTGCVSSPQLRAKEGNIFGKGFIFSWQLPLLCLGFCSLSIIPRDF